MRTPGAFPASHRRFIPYGYGVLRVRQQSEATRINLGIQPVHGALALKIFPKFAGCASTSAAKGRHGADHFRHCQLLKPLGRNQQHSQAASSSSSTHN